MNFRCFRRTPFFSAAKTSKICHVPPTETLATEAKVESVSAPVPMHATTRFCIERAIFNKSVEIFSGWKTVGP